MNNNPLVSETRRRSTKESILIVLLAILLIGVFGTVCVYSIYNTNVKHPTCVVCVNGTPSTFRIGNVITLPCGATPTVQNTGNSSDLVLDFGIPGTCQGDRGTNGSITVTITDTSAPNVTHTSIVTYNLNDRIVYINITDNPAPVLPLGPAGPQGPVGPTGPMGVTGPIGPIGPIGTVVTLAPPIRISTPGIHTIPIPPNTTVFFYLISGGGGGGGGAHGQGGGNAGGGGGSGRRLSGFELLIGVTSIQVNIGAGGNGGASNNIYPFATAGSDGASTSLNMFPSVQMSVQGGEGGYNPPFFDFGGQGGDGGMGGGAGGSTGNHGGAGGTPESRSMSYDLGPLFPGEQGYGTNNLPGIDGRGGSGAGAYAGAGGQGGRTVFLTALMTGGGGGGGGFLPGSGGNGGSYYASSTGSGGNGQWGGGGGGAGGHLSGTTVYPNFNNDRGGRGGDGYIEYVFA